MVSSFPSGKTSSRSSRSAFSRVSTARTRDKVSGPARSMVALRRSSILVSWGDRNDMIRGIRASKSARWRYSRVDVLRSASRIAPVNGRARDGSLVDFRDVVCSSAPGLVPGAVALGFGAAAGAAVESSSRA